MMDSSKVITAREIAAAESQKATIESYWRERGYTVEVTVDHSASFSVKDRCRPSSISSDMVDGWPKGFGALTRLDRLRNNRGNG